MAGLAGRFLWRYVSKTGTEPDPCRGSACAGQAPAKIGFISEVVVESSNTPIGSPATRPAAYPPPLAESKGRNPGTLSGN
jgi:hypothetical protein